MWRRAPRPPAPADRGAVTGRTASLDALEKEEAAWATEQFKAIRSEAIQAEAALQSSMQWGMASTIAVLVGVLAIAGSAGSASIQAVSIQLVLLGVVLPWFLFAMSLIWLGEVRRLVRTGAYIRWIEDTVRSRLSSISTSHGVKVTHYLSWERALAGEFPDVAIGGRNWEGYAGNLSVFCGGQAIGILLWQIVENAHHVARSFAGDSFWILNVAVYAQVLLMWGIVLFVIFARILPLGRSGKSPRRDSGRAVPPGPPLAGPSRVTK